MLCRSSYAKYTKQLFVFVRSYWEVGRASQHTENKAHMQHLLFPPTGGTQNAVGQICIRHNMEWEPAVAAGECSKIRFWYVINYQKGKPHRK